MRRGGPRSRPRQAGELDKARCLGGSRRRRGTARSVVKVVDSYEWHAPPCDRMRLLLQRRTYKIRKMCSV